jgi:CO/xanthine dehydrogenase Mo-binding subunit
MGQTSSITGRPDVSMPPATAFARHFAAHFAEVEVDIETGEIKLLDYLATQDSGTVVNPQVLKNQAIGGAICGAGFAIYEHLAFDPATGAIKNANLLDYKLLRAADFPHHAMVLFADSYDPVGPFGARGAGEAPIAAAISAVSQAVYNAIGMRVDLPMTPEHVARAWAHLGSEPTDEARLGRARLRKGPPLPPVGPAARHRAGSRRLGRRLLVGFACLFVRT